MKKIDFDEESKGKVLDQIAGDMDDFGVQKHIMPLLNITIGIADGAMEPPNPDPEHEAEESPELEAKEHESGIELSPDDEEEEDGPPRRLRRMLKG